MCAKEHVGQRISEAREAAGLTQRELAERIGLSVSGAQTISNWEGGRREPPVHRLRKIADVTKHPLSFFFTEEEQELLATGPVEEAEALLRLVRIEERLTRIERDLAALRRARDAGQAENGS